MKFCPNCGRNREEGNICICGYDFEKGEAIMQESLDNLNKMNHISSMDPHLVCIELEELKQRKIDVGKLLSVSYDSSGGMIGGYSNYELSFKNNKMTTITRDWHHGKKYSRTYKVDKNKVKEIKDLIIDNNLRAWSELPIDNGLIMYDAPNSYLGLKYEKQTVTLLSRIYMTDEERNILFKIKTMITECAASDNMMEEKILEEGEPLNPTFMGNGMMGGPITHAGFGPNTDNH